MSFKLLQALAQRNSEAPEDEDPEDFGFDRAVLPGKRSGDGDEDDEVEEQEEGDEEAESLRMQAARRKKVGWIGWLFGWLFAVVCG